MYIMTILLYFLVESKHEMRNHVSMNLSLFIDRQLVKKL
jgi:hypothetical protein